jgi:proline dehydrogenase
LSRRFIAGETLGESMAVVRELEGRGLLTTLDLLGENSSRENEAVRATRNYIELLDGIRQEHVGSTISIKLTQLGLDVDTEFCFQNLCLILRKAEECKNFVRIDMEGSRYTEATLALYRQSLDRFGHDQVGIVIQAYLYRSESDIRDLSGRGCNIRLCKGAYMESEEIAIPQKAKVDRNFCRLVEIMLESPCHSAIATHDDRMIAHAHSVIERLGLPGDRYEFQMLFGVRREKQIALLEQGYRMKVYVPFGTQWAPYFMRRLAERPANLLFILRNFFRK